jgi:uncharacterized membrane protein (DUF4010 family)
LSWLSIDFTVFRPFLLALAIGLLVGAERYKSRTPGAREASGIRTFTLFALLGAVTGFVEQVTVTALVFAAIAVLIAQSYRRTSRQSPGLTTELAALVVFWLGYLVNLQEGLAIGLGILLTLILASKAPLHGFIKERVTTTEVLDTLKFLAIVFVVYPILPDHDMGPGGFFNPKTVWFFIVLVSAVEYFGYLAMRLFGRRRGLALSALAGGLVSTVAVTLSLSRRSREAPPTSPICGQTAVLANSMQFPRLLLLMWVAAPVLASELLAPFLTAFGVTVAGAALVWYRVRGGRGPQVEIPLTNPFSFGPALKFGFIFAVILFVTELANRFLGAEGLYLASAVTGFGNVSAIALSVARLVGAGELGVETAATTILIGVATNMITKTLLARANGTRQFTLWMSSGLATLVAVAALVLAFG